MGGEMEPVSLFSTPYTFSPLGLFQLWQAKEETSHNSPQLQPHASCGQRLDIAFFGMGDLLCESIGDERTKYTLELSGKATNILQY